MPNENVTDGPLPSCGCGSCEAARAKEAQRQADEDAGIERCGTCSIALTVASGAVAVLAAGNVCQACADAYFFTCPQCEATLVTGMREENVTTDGTHVCRSCARRHYRWSRIEEVLIPRDDAIYLNDTGGWVTEAWAQFNAYWNDDTEEWYSEEPDHEDDEESAPSSMFDYGENVLNHCSFDKNDIRAGALVFGVELEMESASQDRDELGKICAALNGPRAERHILKSDGSLQYGVELVTIPMTLDQHRKEYNWSDVLEPVQGIARSGTGTTRCGIHIHVNRRALTSLVVGKMLVFLNSPALNQQVVTIAQRDSNGYCDQKTKTLADGKRLSESRYERLNVGEETVELRIFRGNLRPERVLKNLEFAHALVMYCRETSIKDIEKWDNFAAWLRVRVKDYPMLCAFLWEKRVAGFTRKEFSIPRAVRELAQRSEIAMEA